jgi:tRNA 2-thiouridine synthesizing protein A
VIIQVSDALNYPSLLMHVYSDAALTGVVALEVDARHLQCPLPLLKAKQALRGLDVEECIRVLATDAGSLKDFVSFAQLTGQQIDAFFVRDDVYYYLIRKQ